MILKEAENVLEDQVLPVVWQLIRELLLEWNVDLAILLILDGHLLWWCLPPEGGELGYGCILSVDVVLIFQLADDHGREDPW